MTDTSDRSASPASADELLGAFECERILLRHYRNVDGGTATSSIELFADEAELITRGRTGRGRDAIAALLDAREQQRDRVTLHVLTNFDFRRVDHASAHGSGLLGVHVKGADRQPAKLVPYSARFVRQGAQWLIDRLISHDDRTISA